MNQLTALTAGPQAVQQTESTSLLAVIERAARDPAVDVEKLERLMLMRERLEQQQSRKSFNAAMARAKSEIGPIFKNKAVDFTSTRGRTNYKYEDLAEIARTIDPVLAKYGLSYRYRAEQNGVKLRVTCVVSHEDGWFEETSLEGENDSSGNKNPIQGVGSTATFLQRYTLKMSFGLAASVDDDGRGGVIDDQSRRNCLSMSATISTALLGQWQQSKRRWRSPIGGQAKSMFASGLIS